MGMKRLTRIWPQYTDMRMFVRSTRTDLTKLALVGPVVLTLTVMATPSERGPLIDSSPSALFVSNLTRIRWGSGLDLTCFSKIGVYF